MISQTKYLALIFLWWAVSAAPLLSQPVLTVQRGHQESVYRMVFSRDGKLLATSSLDNTVHLWDTTLGAELAIWDADGEMLSTLAFSPDGKLLAGAKGTKIIFWSTVTGRRIRTVQADAKLTAINDLAFTADGARLFVMADGEAANCVILDAATGRLVRILATHKNEGLVTGLIAGQTADDALLLTLNYFGAQDLALRETATGRVVWQQNKVTAGLISRDGRTVVWVNKDNGQLVAQNVATARPLWTMPAQGVHHLAWSADGKQIWGLQDTRTLAWDTATGALLAQNPQNYGNSSEGNSYEIALAFTWSPDAQLLAHNPAGERGTEVVLYERTGRPTHTLAAQVLPLTAVAFSPDGTALALGPNDRYLGGGGDVVDDQTVLLTYANGTQMRSLRRPSGAAFHLAYSPDGKLLAVSNFSSLALWDTVSGKLLREFDKTVGISTSAFSPDGKMLASYNYKTITVWEVASGRVIRAVTPQPILDEGLKLSSLTFTPDSKSLLFNDLTKNTRFIYDLTTPDAPPRTVNLANPQAATDGPPAPMVFTPDGKSLVAPDARRRIVWADAATGKIGRVIAPAPKDTALLGYLTVRFSPDGQTLAALGWEKPPAGATPWRDGAGRALPGRMFLRLWDAATGREKATLRGHTALIYSFDFSPDGQYLISGGQDCLAKIWDTTTGRELAAVTSVGLNDWLVATPDGLFDGSPGAWAAVQWRFSDAPRDFAPVETFFNDYYYPNLLTDLLAGKRPAAPRSLANIDRRAPQVNLSLANAPANSAASLAPLTTRRVALKVNISNAPAGARDVRLFRNGSLVKIWAGDVLGTNATAELTAEVTLVAGRNQFTAYAFNRDNSKSPDANLTLTGADALKRRGTIYALAAGVNEYANPQFNLKYATADAEDFLREFARRQQGLGQYARIAPVLLTNDKATKANILLVLHKIAEQAQPEDSVILYFAGHGLAQNPRFYMIPHDLGYTGERTKLDAAGLQTLLSHSVSDLELQAVLEKIDAGQMLLVLDACESGQALEASDTRRGPMNVPGLAQLAYEKGMYILTAAQSYQAALEASKLGHGYLTYTLIEEGLRRNLADAPPFDKQISLREWFDYAVNRVPQMQQERLATRQIGLTSGNSPNATSAAPNPVNPCAAQRQIGLGAQVAVGENPCNVQRPRAFYRRETEPQTFIVGRSQ